MRDETGNHRRDAETQRLFSSASPRLCGEYSSSSFREPVIPFERAEVSTGKSQSKPELFLDLIRRQQRGRLKIYLGFAAGVGKTYDMLQEGNRLRRQGIDVVIGYVEPHGRPETDRPDRRTGAGALPTDRVPRHRAGGNGRGRGAPAAAERLRWSTSWPTPTPPAAATPSATRTSRKSSAPASTSSAR